MSDAVTHDDSGPAALIIQPGAVGDVILTLPLLRLLKAEYGYQRVDVAGHLERLTYLAGKTAIDQALSIDRYSLHGLFTDPKSFDLSEDDPLLKLLQPYELIVTFLADEQGYFEQNLIMTAIRQRPVEVVTLTLRPPQDFWGHASLYFISQFAEQMIQKPHLPLARYLQAPLLPVDPAANELGVICRSDSRGGTARSVTLHPGSGGEDKCWPLERFCQLAEKLQAMDFQPLFLLGPAETERWGPAQIARLSEQVQIVQSLTLEAVVSLLSQSVVYIGNDSGISQLAGAMDVPSLVIFGPTNPQHWRPLSDRCLVCRSDPTDSRWPAVDEVLSKFKQVQ